MRRAFIVLLIIAAAAAARGADETLPPEERAAILKLFPPSVAEKLETRDTDVILTLGGETIRCTLLGFRDDTLTLRVEGQKVNLPLGNVKHLLLAQGTYDVMQNRLEGLPAADAAGRYTLALEALAQAGQDPRITPWVEEVLRGCAQFGRYVPAYVALGDLQAGQGNFALAEMYLAKAVELAPDDGPALGKYAAVLRRQLKFVEAERWYREALRRTPGDPDLLEGLGFVFLKRDRTTEAGEFYRQALDLRPDHPLAQAGYALVLGYAGRYIEARALLDRVAASGTVSAEGYLAMGKLAYMYGRWGEAEGFFLNALKSSTMPEDPAILAHLAMTYAAAGDLPRARRIADGFVREEAMAQPDAANARGYIFLREGEALAAAGDAAGAGQACTRARDAFLKGLGALESNYYAQYGIGIANLRLGNEREGLTSLYRAYEAHPRFAEARLAAAEHLAGTGQPRAALAEYDVLMKRSLPLLRDERAGLDAAGAAAGDGQALRRAAEDLMVRILIGRVRVLLALDRLEEAVTAAAAARTDLPGRAEPFEYLGYAAYVSGDEDLAREHFAAGKEAGSGYCQRRYQELLLARNQSEQVDDFNREDSLVLRNNWEETERAGVEIRIAGGRAVLEGTITKAWAQSYFSRNYRAATFVSAGAVVAADPERPECFAGLFILGQKNGRGIFLIRSDKGRLCFSSSDRQEEGKDWKWFDIGPWPADGQVTLGFKQVDKAMRKFDLLVNDKKVQTILSGSLVKEEFFRVGCFVQGRDQAPVRVFCDDFRVITEKVD